MNNLPRIVAITADGSRWLLDAEYVERVWTAFLAIDDIGHLPDLSQDAQIMFDALEAVEGWDDAAWKTSWWGDVFANARLVGPSSDVMNLIRHGETFPEPDVLASYASALENDAEDFVSMVHEHQLYNDDYPKFELATNADLNPVWR